MFSIWKSTVATRCRCAAVVLSLGSMAAATAGAALDDRDQQRAVELAGQLAFPEHAPVPITRSRQTGQTLSLPGAGLGLQTLSVDADVRKNQPERRVARVYQFDYSRGLSRQVLVDLKLDQVLEQMLIESVHLPLNAAEIRWARSQVARDDSTVQRLQREFHARGRLSPLILDQLEVKASIFEPHGSGHACSTQRCALLSLFDAQRVAFNTEPVINLMTGVVSVLGDAR